MVMAFRLAFLLSLLWGGSGCGGCFGNACGHPLSVLITLPPGVSFSDPLLLEVEYDGERRTITCTSDASCEMRCGDDMCPEGRDDVVASTNTGPEGELLTIEFAVGHMGEQSRKGDSSCYGAENISIEVSVGETVFERVEFSGLSYERDEDYGGGPGCGVADRASSRMVTLEPMG